MNTKTLVFTDLDDTLIQTKRKIPQGAHFSIGATDKMGQSLSFFTQSQRRLLALFEQQNALIIPVTGRDTAALKRVQYDFHSYAVVSHGAAVLIDHQLCPHWLTQIQADLSYWAQLLEQNHQEVQQIIQKYQLDARSRVIFDQEIPAYLSIKGEANALATIKQYNQLRTPFHIHENGRNHALLPPYASKKKAVHYIQQQLDVNENDLIIGLGDSLTDLPFMLDCQFSMIPTQSQIARQLADVKV